MSEHFYFTSEEHRARFLATMQAIDKIYDGYYEEQRVPLIQEEYGAAVYVLTSRSGTWERAKNYVSRRGIQFDELLANEHWSGGYTCLLELAGNLFNAGYTKCDPVDLVTRLDDSNFTVAMTALHIRRRSWPVAFFQQQAE